MWFGKSKWLPTLTATENMHGFGKLFAPAVYGSQLQLLWITFCFSLFHMVRSPEAGQGQPSPCPSKHLGISHSVCLFLCPCSTSRHTLNNKPFQGMSKMCHIIDSITNFLKSPYNSAMHPLSVIFPTGASIGQPVTDFSLRVKVGMSKSLCIKTIILAAVSCDLMDEEVLHLLPQFQSYFSAKAICAPEGTEKEEIFGAMQAKMQEAARPRPDCMQCYEVFAAQAKADGLDLPTAFQKYFDDFDNSINQNKQEWSELERCVILQLTDLTDECRKSIAYHWDNYPAQKSGS